MSQKLDLNFAKSQAFSFSRLPFASLLMLLAGLLLATYVAMVYKDKDHEYHELQQELNQIKPITKPLQTNIVSQKIPVAELKQINDITSDLSTPWNQLLAALEQLEMRDIALLSLEPSKKKQQIVLGGQAKNMQAALNYIEALEKLPVLSQVYLLKHNVDRLDPFKPVAFTIVAQWS